MHKSSVAEYIYVKTICIIFLVLHLNLANEIIAPCSPHKKVQECIKETLLSIQVAWFSELKNNFDLLKSM